VYAGTAWSAGQGSRVEGPIGSILMLLTGRTVALAELSGVGAPELQNRVSTIDGATDAVRGDGSRS